MNGDQRDQRIRLLLAGRVGVDAIEIGDDRYVLAWSVDGQPAELRVADHGVVAVAVPAGLHTIALTYRSPAGGAGLVITVVALIGVAVLAFVRPARAGMRRWSARRTAPT